jgi:hypothetical protein
MENRDLVNNSWKKIDDDVPEITLNDMEQFHNSNVKNTIYTLLFKVIKRR